MSQLPDKGVVARVGDRELRVTAHAIHRYRDRSCRELSLVQAMAELVSEIERIGVTDLTVPSWAFGLAMANEHADEYISIDEKLLLPVEDGVVTTCLTRESVGATIRWTRGRRAA